MTSGTGTATTRAIRVATPGSPPPHHPPPTHRRRLPRRRTTAPEATANPGAGPGSPDPAAGHLLRAAAAAPYLPYGAAEAALAVFPGTYGRMSPMPSLQKTSAPQDRSRTVIPTHRDKVAAAGSELIGGPYGRRAGGRHRAADAGAGDRAAWPSACTPSAWCRSCPATTGPVVRAPTSQYTHACYSDIPHLFAGRGFADGLVPYFDRLGGDIPFLEYPVLTGLFMEVAAWLTPGGDMTQAGAVVLAGQRGPADGLRGRPRGLCGPDAPAAPLGRSPGRARALGRAHRHDQLGHTGRRADGRRRPHVVAGAGRWPSGSCWAWPRRQALPDTAPLPAAAALLARGEVAGVRDRGARRGRRRGWS
ncbi:hypothetical protein STANM309S_05551 [Streptomyces tanashiensis]